MASDLQLRKAHAEDLDAMVEVFLSAFSDSPLNARCFPPSDPVCMEYHVDHVRKVLADPISEMLIVEDFTSSDPKESILGWARWVRRPAPKIPPPPVICSPDSYPQAPAGDPVFAAHFFQLNVDQTQAIVAGRDHWHLSLIMVRKEAQGRGVASMLMRWGVDRADEDGWMVSVNGSEAGRPVYEKFGFEVVEISNFDAPGVLTYHMKREAKS